MLPQFQVTAHRGSSLEAPENTLAAIQLAIAQQVDYIEVDIQQTQDGQLVLLHDSNLQRLAQVNQNIWELSSSQLQELEVGSWFSPEFAGEKIPTLETVLKLVKNKVKLNLELKINGNEQNFALSLVKLLNDTAFSHECVLSSFNYPILSQIKQVCPQLPIGLIICQSSENILETGVNFYSIPVDLVNIDLIASIHRAGKQVHVWTVNELAQMRNLVNFGVDNIITDCPKIAVRLKKELLNRS